MEVTRVVRIAARDQALHRRAMARDRSARQTHRRRDASWRRAPHDGRRADVCLHRRHGRRGVELPRPWGRRSACFRANSSSGCARNSGPAACCITDRANGIRASNCRAGLSAVTGAKTACRCGRTTRSSPTNRKTTVTARSRRSALVSHWRQRLAWIRSGWRPAYEDVYYYLWKEKRLPVNVDVLESNLKDEMERDRIARIFHQRARQRRRLCVAVEARLGRRRTPLAQRPVVLARRAHVPHSRRFADGPAPAARLAAVGGRARLSVAESSRSDERLACASSASAEPAGVSATSR